MAGTSDRQGLPEQVSSTAQLLADLNAQDVVALDLSGKSSVTDYFVIGTVSSQTQLRGIVKAMDEHFTASGIECRHGARGRTQDLWTLLDCNDFIVHLMTRDARDFYALEKLWFESSKVEFAAGKQSPT